VPSNIAEGAARRSRAEYLRFLSIARGSLAELDTQLKIASRLELVAPESQLRELLDRTFARLNALIRAVEKPPRIGGPAASSESQIPNLESHAR
jgi:four helix bundle protein